MQNIYNRTGKDIEQDIAYKETLYVGLGLVMIAFSFIIYNNHYFFAFTQLHLACLLLVQTRGTFIFESSQKPL